MNYRLITLSLHSVTEYYSLKSTKHYHRHYAIIICYYPSLKTFRFFTFCLKIYHHPDALNIMHFRIERESLSG